MGLTASQQLYEVNGVPVSYSDFKKAVQEDGGNVPSHARPQQRGIDFEDLDGPIFNYETSRTYKTGKGRITW